MKTIRGDSFYWVCDFTWNEPLPRIFWAKEGISSRQSLTLVLTINVKNNEVVTLDGNVFAAVTFVFPWPIKLVTNLKVSF